MRLVVMIETKETSLRMCYSACFSHSDPNNGLDLLTLLAWGVQIGPRTHTKVSKQDLTHRKLEEKMRERTEIFVPCSCFQDGLFVISGPEGKSTFGASESGNVPGFVAGTSGSPSGREVRTGHLAHRNVGNVTEDVNVRAWSVRGCV